MLININFYGNIENLIYFDLKITADDKIMKILLNLINILEA